jgi:hypothetical protein
MRRHPVQRSGANAPRRSSRRAGGPGCLALALSSYTVALGWTEACSSAVSLAVCWCSFAASSNNPADEAEQEGAAMTPGHRR